MDDVSRGELEESSTRSSSMLEKTGNQPIDISDYQKIEGFRQRLQDINPSDPCITALSQELTNIGTQWLIRQHLEVWANAILQEMNATKVISLFYVINDFIQNSFSKPQMLNLSLPYLKAACASIGQKRNASLPECQRVVSIWRRRFVFGDGNICLAFTKLLQRQSALEDIRIPDVPTENFKDIRNRTAPVQRDGRNNDGYVRPYILERNEALLDISEDERQFRLDIQLSLKNIVKIREELATKIQFVQKLGAEDSELMLRLNALLKQDHLSGLNRHEEVENIRNSMRKNRVKRKLLLEKKWKLRHRLHSVLESIDLVMRNRIQRIWSCHIDSYNFCAMIRNEMALRGK
ncbi:hypothetical protein IE077_004118 [Cardiosporidium cionae]|uniref:CID domain-containing protein n=1 Tax=Cardiosporidium cionae TaxID=476202 RepID=A0ABQ7JE47_9APIC|nr:hypothetical protein IE077_004118 [Cardiosporidium cionae]|eukprot:KAF8822279.1 hypothetical protein IE077_004118 [Cardiosporidium cionae]